MVTVTVLLVAQLLATCTCFSLPWWRDAIDRGHSPWGRALEPDAPPERRCECVPEYNCDYATKEIITDGSNAIDFREKNPCPDDEVCCFLPEDSSEEDNKGSTGTPTEHTTTTTTTPASSIGRSQEKFSCGERSQQFSLKPKIAGDYDDTETVEGEFPWALLLELVVPSTDGKEPLKLFQCGASLIHPHAAITAAHCVGKDTNNLNLRAGEYDLVSNDERFEVQDRKVSKVILHPKYSLHPIRNDIAILFVDTPFVRNDATNTICLPNGKDNIKWKSCAGVGWGAKNSARHMREDQIMRKAEMDIVPRETCLEQLRQTRLGKLFRLHKSFMCAGGQTDADTCLGDGGGPYSCTDETGRYYQVGITSWGVDGCQNKNIPGGYTDVARMYEWILESMAEVSNLQEFKV